MLHVLLLYVAPPPAGAAALLHWNTGGLPPRLLRRRPSRCRVGGGAGGWKMKLALARAILLEAGLLLLDEPTNHMDTANVLWLERYLLSCGTTLITVSHDSGFLDNVCTGIIHYENKKLAKYRGNLSAFVAQKPEAKVYYELTDEFVKFKFPIPGPLDGVKCAPLGRRARPSYKGAGHGVHAHAP